MIDKITLELTHAEIELLTHALDSHVLWMSEDADRIREDDEDIIEARELEEKLVALL